ncbi:MAG: BMP family ABC transporter substrate-binding protein [Leptolyngbyaceae cyanobacterium bins.59]|nr:BMP family ABC transporter substrate-binding protein [Leptolyngbyaceae cyanobacterium bins.59]
MNRHKSIYIPRRQVIRGILATAAFAGTSKLWTGCTPAPETPPAASPSPGGASPSASADKPIVMGFVYVGPKDDFGYNQAHAEGAAGVAKSGLVKIVEEANVPETNAVEETMRNMIEQDGATVLFPTSFGYFDPHMLKLAKEYPEVQFFHCGGLYDSTKHPNNVGSYFGYIDEGQYIAGIVAAHMSKSGKLGFIAAKPIPQLLRNVNSYTLGARSVNPKVTTQVIFTGEWSQLTKEVAAANSMADQGVDVITCHVDSPKAIMETAEKRKIFCTGYHANQSSLAPQGYLTGAEWDWTNVYTSYANQIKAGKTLMNGGIPHLLRGGLKDGFLKISDYGPAVTAEAKKDADAAKAKLMDGSLVIYRGGVKDNAGKVVIPKDYAQTAPELESMNWLVEGVIGKVG